MLKRNIVVFSLVASSLLALAPNHAYALKHNPKATAIPKVKAVNPVIVRNWGLDNDERASHINAKKAWKISKPKKEIIVAVIDTGVDPSHPLIKDHLWHDKKTGSYGYDFVFNKNNPTDNHGHGTHVSGIILAAAGAETNKNSKVRVMPVKYFDPTGTNKDHLDFTVKAIEWAVDHGARIINFSTEGVGFNRAEYRAIQRAEEKGVLFVTAAGNQAQDNDNSGTPCYPASYELPNIVTVAATNIRNELVPISNYGPKHVHVAAPGERIFSTLPNSAYGYLTGTSQATAFVSGLAAMILSENPSLTPTQVREILEKSSDPIPSLKTKVMAGGRINAYSALLAARAEAKRSKASQVAQSQKPDGGTPLFPLNLLGRSDNRDLTATPQN